LRRQVERQKTGELSPQTIHPIAFFPHRPSSLPRQTSIDKTAKTPPAIFEKIAL